MPGLGVFNPFPLEFGGAPSAKEAALNTLLDNLEPYGFTTEEDSSHYSECLATAGVIDAIWAVNERGANQFIPERMMEMLPKWEEACGLRPGADDLDVDRRKRLAARFRAAANNTLADVHAAATKLCGANFEALVLVAPTDVLSYWPLNPGPPGFEWSSNRARLGIRLNKDGLTEAAWQRMRSELWTTVDAMLSSAWTLTIGTGSSFTIGSSILGQAFV